MNIIIRNKTITFIFVFIITILFTSGQSDQTIIKTQIENNQNEIKKLEQEIIDFNNKIKDKKSDAASLKNTISDLENRKKILEKDIRLANYKIENKRYDITEIESKISDTTKKLKVLELGLLETFRELVHLGDLKESDIFVFLGSRSISEIFDRYNRSNKLREDIDKSINHFTDTKNNLTVINSGYRNEVKNLELMQDELSDKKSTVILTQKEKDTLLKETKAQESAYQKLLADRKKQKIALEKEVLDYESKLKALVDKTKLPKSGSGVLGYPVKNVKITQYFGNTPFSTANPQIYNGSGHNGIDFAVQTGSAIYSVADGVVSSTGDTDINCKGTSYGKWILIKHNNGLTTLYAHLSSINVSEGQAVTTGEKIALSGNTGYSTGPHLHFTVFASDAVSVSDPKTYRSKTCGTYMKLPVAPRGAYLNPLTYL